MPQRKFLTIAEQVAAHLREELQRGRWTVEMPGRHELAAELGVSDQTAKAALAQLEKEGILVPQGAGRRRRIELPTGRGDGHTFAAGGDPGRRAGRPAARLSGRDQARAGRGGACRLFHPVVHARARDERGVDRPQLASAPRRMPGSCFPALAPLLEVVRRARGAGLRAVRSPARVADRRGRARQAARHRAGHPTADRSSATGGSCCWRCGRSVCRSRGRACSPFSTNWPPTGWRPAPTTCRTGRRTSTVFIDCLNRLFQHTPPTALIVDEAAFFVATMQFLHEPSPAGAGGRVADLHRRRSALRLVPAVDRPHPLGHPPGGAAGACAGRPTWPAASSDVRQTLTKAEFVEGGTIGPAPVGR